jgi:hypothetical protein
VYFLIQYIQDVFCGEPVQKLKEKTNEGETWYRKWV